MQIKQAFDDKLGLYMSVDDEVAMKFIFVEYFIFEQIEHCLLETIGITTEHDPISLVYSQIDFLVYIFEVLQRNFLIGDRLDVVNTFDQEIFLLAIDLLPCGIGRSSQQVETNGQTIE